MRTFVVGTILAAAAGLLADQKQTGSPETAPKADIQFAQDLSAAAYPELTANRLSFVFENQGKDVRLNAGEVIDPFQLDSSLAILPVLSVTVGFDADGSWSSLEAKGEWVRSDDYVALQQRVQQQPFQSARESQVWLAARGAKNGPDRSVPVDQRLNRSDWSRLLQANVIIQSSGFRWTDPQAAGVAGKVMPGWVAVISLTRPSGLFESYEVLFEPFNGRIVRMRRE